MAKPKSSARRVCLPSGFLPVGRKVRAVCSCGFRTTPRVNRDRALDALLSEHGYTDPICALCGKNHYGHGWVELRTRHVEILTVSDTDEQFLVCRGMPRSCRDGAAQRQLHLDQAAATQLGIELPRPPLRLIHGDAKDRRS